MSTSRCDFRSAGKTGKVTELARLSGDISILIIWAERYGDVVERMIRGANPAFDNQERHGDVRKDACVTRVSVKRGGFDGYSVIGGSGIEIPVEIQSAPFVKGLEGDKTHKSGGKELVGNGLKALNISGVKESTVYF